MELHGKHVCLIVLVLLAVQAVLVVAMVHRESLTFDEDNHMFAGFMMWKTGDYGLNPEHPPLVKLLAAVPVLREKLWIPPLQGRPFKEESYLDGRDWLARNDGASQRFVFRMRLAAGLLAWGLSLIVFFAAREWFGTTAALIALTLLVFDPDVMAHSALVTTDIGVSLFFLASIYALYSCVTRPGVARPLATGIAAGLLAATKHSGILFIPMVLPVLVYEAVRAGKGMRLRQAVRLCGALAGTVVIATVVLWAFYEFRFAARPAGLTLNPSFAQYTERLSPFDSHVLRSFAHMHLLPESYLMGLADVKHMAESYPTFIFGTVHAHGVWYYFPAVILIKSTPGLLALNALALWAALSGRLGKAREVVWLLTPGAVYLLIAMASGIDIGARHILPLYAMAAIFAGAGAAALASRSRAWVWVVTVLIAAHIASSLLAYPNQIAYANEAWGGVRNTHNLLSDANVDWGQQLYQVKAWQDRHPGEECWFAYFARPEVDPATYGIACHALPTIDTLWLGGWEVTPPVLHGAVLISAGDLSGCEWPSGLVNPYRDFQKLKPDEVIDDSVFVYQGDLHAEKAAAFDRMLAVWQLLGRRQAQAALALAQDAVAIAPGDLFAETALGDAEAGMRNRDAARAAWESALAAAQKLEPDAQSAYVPNLERQIARTQNGSAR
ncbi:MAG TPA: glycosyltransferase family 39 protein [Acidobacteriaceae bacterium]|nr:glycosyltransferase family 39 protein [Acidobacteriaceae bacterium]